jgi:hypothetical protein
MFQTAQFNLESDQNQLSLGNDFIVSVYVDTAGQPTNTVFARISYPQDKIQFIDSSFTDSKFPSIVERKTENGLIKLTSFTTTPYNGNNGLFARLKFRPILNSEATITIENNSKIHASDGLGTDVSDQTTLPVSLTLYTSEQNKPPIVKKGETILILAEEGQRTTELSTQQSSPVPFDFTEKEIADYSTFSGYPKEYPPGQISTKGYITSYKVFGMPVFFLALVIVFLFLLFLLIKLLKEKSAS